MADGDDDFREVAHCGGKIKFHIATDETGRRMYSVEYSGLGGRMALFGIYALPEGIPCGGIQLGGIGQPWNPPPFDQCVPVLVQSDSQGRFGYQCPKCGGYFRASTCVVSCCYCGWRGESWAFLTEAQHNYVRHYTRRLMEGLESEEPNLVVVIDMDAISDAAVMPKPDFYFPGQVQQTQFTCRACNCWNDIKGQYGYCAQCGTRNNVERLAGDLHAVRERLIAGALAPHEALRAAVSAFDSCCRNFVGQLCDRVAMIPARREWLGKMLFHNLDGKAEGLKTAFGFDVLNRIDGDARAFVRMMFHRRHAFEHDGGHATARYIEESGDTSVPEGALIRETSDNMHRMIGLLNRVASNLDEGFHEIFPPEAAPLKRERERQALIAGRRG